ncbi:Response regulator of zinc sigma-54-dependent two-component system [Desulfovibrio sp. DV]|uniref:sigma 54-interacting transcriptional regulator n=1 Tax=Desulfovibrio sp. DV TaxID=1844708 RepID=UPI00094B8001|nr:sigma 54-interacting transcriptional regulator [Desulfovibrio sp. DV]OLN27609.1 Response regulator of zinc sigma-54-dependent two-component system [Desulfovibrio sp. DV]
MQNVSLPPNSTGENDPLADLPTWFTQREVIPLDDTVALVVCHEAMHAVVSLCRSVAEGPAPVLLTGETGVGKSLLARFIHASRNPYAPFVSRMTAGLEASVLEKWIFGGPDHTQTGPAMVDEACGGMLVLEEMGDLPVAIQQQLLDSWNCRCSGESKIGPVQWVCTTNLAPRALCAPKRMLPEFLNRFVRIHVPPLRDRKRDIPALAAYFSLLTTAREPSRSSLDILAKRLSRHSFPGNVRELESLVSLNATQGRSPLPPAGAARFSRPKA